MIRAVTVSDPQNSRKMLSLALLYRFAGLTTQNECTRLKYAYAVARFANRCCVANLSDRRSILARSKDLIHSSALQYMVLSGE